MNDKHILMSPLFILFFSLKNDIGISVDCFTKLVNVQGKIIDNLEKKIQIKIILKLTFKSLCIKLSLISDKLN